MCYHGSLMLRTRWLLVVLGLAAGGCGSSGVVQTALHGDLQSLQREVRAEQKSGELDRDTVVELAQAIAGREVRAAKGRAAIQRIRSVRPCASSLLAVLEDRAERADDVAAEATLVLFELGKLSAPRLVERHRDASSGAWRAVAARAAVAPKYSLLRRQWMADADERVRRGALSAAIDAAHPGDTEALLEAARLDPDSLSRSLALRAVGAVGGRRAALALDDLWARADETTRVAIVDAWAMPAAYRTGGRERLVRIVETARGIPPLAAAEALARQDGSEARIGVAALLRAISDGTPTERELAIRVAPLDDADVVAAVKKSAKERDRSVRVIALARLIDLDAERAAAVKGLHELARKDDDAAIQARAALAAANDSSVVPSLAKQLSSRRSFERTAAGVGLMRLGEWPRVATALADDDPLVRTTVACSVLSHAKDGG